MCFDDNARPPIPVSEGSGADGKPLHLTSSDGTRVAAYLAEPGEAGAAQVLILPDVRGLHQFYRELALRLAESGVRALAIDYFGRTAENDDRAEPFDYAPHVGQMTPDTFRADLQAGLALLREGSNAERATFTLGFCMGGTLSFWAGTLDHTLAGVIGFYAGLRRTRGAVTPAVEWADTITPPLLGLFGGADEGIPQADIDEFEAGLNRRGTAHEIVVYDGAPHSFFDRRAAEHAAASADAWNRVQAFIADHSPVRA